MPDQTLEWLLEPDASNGVRYFALQWLLDRPADDPDVLAAHAAVMQTGPVPRILASQHPDGWWDKPGPGYSTMYRGTVWQLIAMDRLGANGNDDRVRRACEHVLSHTLNVNGAFGWASSGTTRPPGPSAGLHCLNGRESVTTA